MTLKLLKAEWADASLERRKQFAPLIRELMSLHCLCEESCLLVMDPQTGNMNEMHKNSALHWSRAFEWPWAIENADLKRHDRCLDAGGGHAVFQYALASRTLRVTNLDKNAKSLAAVQKMREKGFASRIGVDMGEIEKLPYKNASFDKVFCISVLEHTDNWETCFNELERVVGVGGRIVVTLDVIHDKKEDQEEFLIDIKSLSDFFAKRGMPFPEAQGIMVNEMENGDRLSCLCLCFVKES